VQTSGDITSLITTKKASHAFFFFCNSLVQVEERLRFYEEGVAPRKNLSVMQEAMKGLAADLGGENGEEEE
jgi:hypothetical protein